MGGEFHVVHFSLVISAAPFVHECLVSQRLTAKPATIKNGIQSLSSSNFRALNATSSDAAANKMYMIRHINRWLSGSSAAMRQMQAKTINRDNAHVDQRQRDSSIFVPKNRVVGACQKTREQCLRPKSANHATHNEQRPLVAIKHHQQAVPQRCAY